MKAANACGAKELMAKSITIRVLAKELELLDTMVARDRERYGLGFQIGYSSVVRGLILREGIRMECPNEEPVAVSKQDSDQPSAEVVAVDSVAKGAIEHWFNEANIAFLDLENARETEEQLRERNAFLSAENRRLAELNSMLLDSEVDLAEEIRERAMTTLAGIRKRVNDLISKRMA